MGPPATPHNVGTLARIQHTLPLPDGSFFVRVVGDARFLVRELDLTSKPYPQALVVPLPPSPDAANVPATFRLEVLRLLFDYRVACGRFTPATTHPPEREIYPDRFSWSVAEEMPLTQKQRQELLEMQAVTPRLAREKALLTDILLDSNRLREASSSSLPFSIN